MHRHRGKTAIFGVFVATASALTCAALFSCLPDLPALPAEEAGVTPSTAGCGDGIIQQSFDGGGEQCDPGLGISPGCADDCRILCDEDQGAVLSPGEHCYFLAGTSAQFADANERCRKLSAHVVTLATAEEATFVARTFPEHWLGLSESATAGAFASVVADEPGFPIPPQSGPCTGCFGGAAPGDAGLPQDPAVDSGVLSCVRRSPDNGAWLRVPCTYTRELPIVCEREPVGARSEPCVGGVCMTLSVSRTQKSYLYVPTPVTASQARASCTGIGGKLVVFSQQREREELAREVRALLPTQPLVSFWVGLAEADAGAIWAWDDGVAEGDRARAWGDKEPLHGGRAYLQLSSGSYDSALLHTESNPDALHAYVCERAPLP